MVWMTLSTGMKALCPLHARAMRMNIGVLRVIAWATGKIAMPPTPGAAKGGILDNAAGSPAVGGRRQRRTSVAGISSRPVSTPKLPPGRDRLPGAQLVRRSHKKAFHSADSRRPTRRASAIHSGLFGEALGQPRIHPNPDPSPNPNPNRRTKGDPRAATK